MKRELYPTLRLRRFHIALAILLPIILLALPGAVLLAQSGGGYDLSWWTVDGGGVTFNTENGYSLGGTAGQPDAGVWSGGEYSLAGGFWHGGVLSSIRRVYLPLVMRSG